ncbi:MAG: glycosyltransferase family 39 protein [Phycisphaerales bacterium JB037]
MLLCLTVYLPGFFRLPPVDRDESRFAQASRQMFESVALPAEQQQRGVITTWDGAEAPGMHSGGLAIPMVQNRARLNKPPLIYWAQAGGAAIATGGDPLRDAIWMYRIPSLLAGLATALLTWRLGCRMLDPRAAWLGGALLGIAPVFVWEAHQARADMLLVTITTGAMLALWTIWRAGRRRSVRRAPWAAAAGLWILIGLGVLTKGPVTPMVVGLSALALCATTGRWRWLLGLRPVAGIVIVVAMVAPWVIAVGQQIGWEQYAQTVIAETLGRSAAPREGHFGPPGYHALLAVPLLWPGSMLIGLALPRAWRKARGAARGARIAGEGTPSLRSGLFCGRDAETFLVCWIVPSWIVFELVMTKLPHYTMPLYPALALLCARAVLAAETGRLAGLGRRIVRVALAGFGVLSAALVGAAVVAGVVGLLGSPVGLAAVAMFSVLGVSLLWRWAWLVRLGRFAAAQGTLVGVAVALWACTLGATLPGARAPWVSSAVMAQAPAPLSRLGAIEYHEDSLMFLTRARMDRIDRGGLEAWLGEHPDGVIVGPSEAISDAAGLEQIGVVEGFNYARGKWVRLSVARRGAP